jgi:fatty-acyl-CoA synthase
MTATSWQRPRDCTIGELVRRLVAAFPDREALVEPALGVRWSFRELDARALEVARAFLALGVRPGDRVTVWAENVPEWIVLELGLARIGVVLVTANTALKAPEIEYLLAQSESCALVLSAGSENNSYPKSLAQVRERLPLLKHAVFVGGDRAAPASAPPGTIAWRDLLALAPRATVEEVARIEQTLRPDDVVNMQYTSGTTGFPKGVMLTHRNLVNNSHGIGTGLRFAPGERLALTVPLFHCFGCVVGTLGAYVSALTICLLDRFDAAKALDLVQRERCNVLYGVPTHFRLMVEEQERRPRDLATLRAGIMGGAPCPEELVRRLVTTLHLPHAVAAYGLTECSPGVTVNDPTDSLERRATTVGRPMPGIELRVVDPATLREVERGATGELWVRGDCVMKGYWNQPDATAEVLRPGGWLRTGDLAAHGRDDYLRIVGRLKEMVIRGGENVYPVEVEDALRRHPGVRDVAVFGVPDPVYGEEVCAAFLPRTDDSATSGTDATGRSPPTQQELQEFLKERLAGVKIPTRIWCVASFPTTASGKVQKFRLAEQFAQLG